nr:hypothetical protein [Shewanella cyperi]
MYSAQSGLGRTRKTGGYVCHPLHFLLTLLTLGAWAPVWWYLIVRAEGRSWLSGFDDDYWSYLMEREMPPAALHPLHIDDEPRGWFDA